MVGNADEVELYDLKDTPVEDDAVDSDLLRLSEPHSLTALASISLRLERSKDGDVDI